jgi:hypothetical protein
LSQVQPEAGISNFFLPTYMFAAPALGVLGHGTSVFEDLEVYVASLEKMQYCFSGRAYPAHGAVIENGVSKITEYIEHRQQRENEVLQVLKFGTLDKSQAQGDSEGQGKPSPNSWTAMELVKVIYRDVPENLHVPASYGVLQVLKKLAAAEKVVHDSYSDTWRIPE